MRSLDSACSPVPSSILSPQCSVFIPALVRGGGACLHWRACLSQESAWCCDHPQDWSEKLAMVACADSSSGKVESGWHSGLNVSPLTCRYQVQSGSRTKVEMEGHA